MLLTKPIRRITPAREAGKESQAASEPDKIFSSEALWLGLLGTTFGVLPVILANRYVIFQDYSHYALPTSLAGVILLVGLVNSIVFRRLRFGMMLGLVAVASLTHYAVSVNALTEEQAIKQILADQIKTAAESQPRQ